MKKIVLLSSKEASNYIHDDHLLEAGLRDAGVEPITKTWEEFEDDGEDLFLIRTTWNYTDDIDRFFSQLEKVQAKLWNPLPLVKWNSNKKYLLELQEKGVGVIPLKFVDNRQSLGPAMDSLGGDDFVLKPVVGAGANGLIRFNRSSPPQFKGEHILQSFCPQIHNGELSLIFFGGKFSHAIRKTPIKGEIRVQEEFGGVVSAHVPTENEMKEAKKAIDCAPGPWLYARVDIVPGAGIIELECIEPSLFFGSSDSAVTNLINSIEMAFSG